VVVSNPPLAQYVSQFHSRITEIPTCVLLEKFPLRPNAFSLDRESQSGRKQCNRWYDVAKQIHGRPHTAARPIAEWFEWSGLLAGPTLL
jgi:hypothetical protein